MSDPHHPGGATGASLPDPRDAAPAADDLPAPLRASAAAATDAALGRLPEVLPWYPRLSPDRRREIEYLTASGVAGFFRWYADPSAPVTAGSLLATAPPSLARSVNLRETLGLIRSIVETVEREADALVPDGDGDALRIAALRYANDIAFSVAKVYARAAETRGAWDARLEATVVDALLRGSTDPGIASRISALGWHGATHVVGMVVGLAPAVDSDDADAARADVVPLGAARSRPPGTGRDQDEDTSGPGRGTAAVEDATRRVRRSARQSGVDLLVGVQGDRVVLVVGATTGEALSAALERLVGTIDSPHVAVGPAVSDVVDVGASLRPAIAALRVAPAWPQAPRPLHADEVLPERALAGDAGARRALVDRIYEPLHGAQSPLLHTLDAYWSAGLGMEATARTLFVHPNTVRYRLHRVSELVGWDPTDPREGFVIRIAVAMGRLEPAREQPGEADPLAPTRPR